MNDHTPTVEETAQAVAAAKASPIFVAAYDAVFEHRRAMTREEALQAANDAYNASNGAAIATYRAARDVYYATYNTELVRINKEYPQ